MGNGLLIQKYCFKFLYEVLAPDDLVGLPIQPAVCQRLVLFVVGYDER